MAITLRTPSANAFGFSFSYSLGTYTGRNSTSTVVVGCVIVSHKSFSLRGHRTKGIITTNGHYTQYYIKSSLRSGAIPRPRDRVQFVRVPQQHRLNGHSRIEGAGLERDQARSVRTSPFWEYEDLENEHTRKRMKYQRTIGVENETPRVRTLKQSYNVKIYSPYTRYFQCLALILRFDQGRRFEVKTITIYVFN